VLFTGKAVPVSEDQGKMVLESSKIHTRALVWLWGFYFDRFDTWGGNWVFQ
jgi:hypothetical protein